MKTAWRRRLCSHQISSTSPCQTESPAGPESESEPEHEHITVGWGREFTSLDVLFLVYRHRLRVYHRDNMLKSKIAQIDSEAFRHKVEAR